MGTDGRPDITVILGRARDGDERAKGELIALIYEELRRVASRLMRRERTDHTLPPTAVVHEAVIRLLGDAVFDKGADRNYLFASAARAMARFSSTTRDEDPPTGAVEAAGASRSIWLPTTSTNRVWMSSRSTRC